MTEREKMLSGALYASEDPELAAARIRARTLCGRLNQTPPGGTGGARGDHPQAVRLGGGEQHSQSCLLV